MLKASSGLVLGQAEKPNGAPAFSAPFAFSLRRSTLRLLRRDQRACSHPPIAQALERTARALSRGALAEAVREMDRAWRIRLPADAMLLASSYARLLSLEGSDPHAAVRLLQHACELAPDPDLAALLSLILWRLDHTDEAREQLTRALSNYAVDSRGLLWESASMLCRDPSFGCVGWVGRGTARQFVGELIAGDGVAVLDVAVDTGTHFKQLLPAGPAPGWRRFSFRAPPMPNHARVAISVDGHALLGSGSALPEHLSIDSRIVSSGRRVTGWVRVGWLPQRRPRLQLQDDEGHCISLAADAAPMPGWRWPITCDLKSAGLSGARVEFSLKLSGSQQVLLPDSPLLLNRAIASSGHRTRRLRRWRAPRWTASPAEPAASTARAIDVIIPVYRNCEETLACLDSVLQTVAGIAHVIVIDDATPEPALAQALDALVDQGRITLLRHARNEGFVASVNQAIALHPQHDVVIVNSDTRVFGDWLHRLRAAAYAGSRVGTVTPFSNQGTIASYPRTAGARMRAEDAQVLDALAARLHTKVRAPIPVGVGFCLFMRRDCLDQIGAFDCELFDKGYGEETDFCLRARTRGWSHLLAADVFVFHAGGTSFQGRRDALMWRSQRLINRRHRGYDSWIADFARQDPLRRLRRALDEQRLRDTAASWVLIVTLALPGGVDRFVRERLQKLQAQGLRALLLRPERAGDFTRCELWSDALELPNLHYRVPSELDALRTLLTQLPLHAVEIQHFLHLDPRVIELVRQLPTAYDVFIHDYAWICPRVTLITGTGRYCGEPAVSVCRTCVRRNGSNIKERISVPALRQRSAQWLLGARRVIAPSQDTRLRLQRHFSQLSVEVEPHSPALATASCVTSVPSAPLRVGIIGIIGRHKGYQILLACARNAQQRSLPIEFVVIGYTQNDRLLLATGKVFITGRYDEVEAPHLIARERLHLVWLPSVWPESWCYSLDYALQAGLPVIAYELGAIAERLRNDAKSELWPLDLSPRSINDRLIQRLGEANPGNSGVSYVARLAPRIPATKIPLYEGDPIEMTKATAEKTQDPPEGQATAAPQGLSASVQVLPLPAGLYLFSVTAASPKVSQASGLLSLPAVQVGLGPGIGPDQVEFLSGPATQGAWLFSPGDLLVARVMGSGATLILSSLRAPGGEVLSIKIERLEARQEAASAAEGVAVAKPGTASTQSLMRDDGSLPLHISAHIRTRGDMAFADAPWAGRIGPGLWIESFSIRPLEQFGAGHIEYKGLTGTGFETPWISDEHMCGTKGMSVPLVGFAMRLKPGAESAAFDCEYSGYFQSGQVVGPLRNGAPCRSSTANDPLEGMQVRLIRRASSSAASNIAAAPATSVKGANEKEALRAAAAARSARGATRRS
jgi:GT2 family glycosyltransferase/glycosyltransferase involved in cell wall biosynthesis